MRFPRNAKIFRGQLDMAPLACLFFVLLIFTILASLLYTPGVPIQLSLRRAQAGGVVKVVVIDRQNRISLDKTFYKESALYDKLREDLKQSLSRPLLVVESHTASSRSVILRLRNLAEEVHSDFEVAGGQIELPFAEKFSGTTSATVSVGINLGGQFFYENRVVSDEELKTILASEVSKNKTPVTLLILADKSTELGVIVRLTSLAREAGIAQALQAVRPRLDLRGAGSRIQP